MEILIIRARHQMHNLLMEIHRQSQGMLEKISSKFL